MTNTYSTNASLPTPVDTYQMTQDFDNYQGAYDSAVTILENILTGSRAASSVGVNATIINTAAKPLVFLQNTSAGSIASITGAIAGKPFILAVQSGASFGMMDAGGFALTTTWIPGPDDTIMLVWTGSKYVEISRSNN